MSDLRSIKPQIIIFHQKYAENAQQTLVISNLDKTE